MQGPGIPKSNLILKSGLAEQSIGTSSTGISNNSIVTAAMSRLKENQELDVINTSASKADLKQRQSPDVMR